MSILKLSDFELIEYSHHDYIELFSDPFEALRAIKGVGANGMTMSSKHSRAGLSRSHIKKMFVNSKTPSLTYKIGIYIARKR